jgi:hypothetical protein
MNTEHKPARYVIFSTPLLPHHPINGDVRQLCSRTGSCSSFYILSHVRSCEKWDSITYSQLVEEYIAYNEKKEG